MPLRKGISIPFEMNLLTMTHGPCLMARLSRHQNFRGFNPANRWKSFPLVRSFPYNSGNFSYNSGNFIKHVQPLSRLQPLCCFNKLSRRQGVAFFSDPASDHLADIAAVQRAHTTFFLQTQWTAFWRSKWSPWKPRLLTLSLSVVGPCLVHLQLDL